MSERIYAVLLRLHSSQFREKYGKDALQLFRDRARDETGFLSKLRLWLDLLADLVISVPQAYRRAEPNLVGAFHQQLLSGVPSFHTLPGESPSHGALITGGLLALSMLAVFPVSINRFASYQPLRPGYEQWKSDPGSAPRKSAQVTGERTRLTPAERQSVIGAVIANLREHYIDPASAHKIANALSTHEANGDYDQETDGAAFANLLTEQLRDVSHDTHLGVIYSQWGCPLG